jgi:hypothetical protein
MSRKPGTSPTVASTDGKDSIPREIVSAIMTVVRSASGLRFHVSMMPMILTHASLPASIDELGFVVANRLRSTHHHSRVLYLCWSQHAFNNNDFSYAHFTSPSSSSPKGSC